MSRQIDTDGQAEERRQHIISAIRKYSEQRGRPPTIREIGALVGVPSTGVISHHLNILEEQGRITRERNLARTVRVVECRVVEL